MRPTILKVIRAVARPFAYRGLSRIWLLRNAYNRLWGLTARGCVEARIQGSRMRLDLRDRVICRTLYVSGVHEPGVTSLVHFYLKPGMVVVDIGAHFGYFTLLAARLVGPHGRVFAFEPEPFGYQMLAENIQLNQYKQVSSFQAALSDKKGVGCFVVNQTGHRGGHHLSSQSDSLDSITVPLVTLDDVLLEEAASHVDLIKMDIEGWEPKALLGMAQTLKVSGGVSLITEFHPPGLRRAGFDPLSYLDQLTAYGFKLYNIEEPAGTTRAVTPRELLAISERDHTAPNLLCTRSDLLLKVS